MAAVFEAIYGKRSHYSEEDIREGIVHYCAADPTGQRTPRSLLTEIMPERRYLELFAADPRVAIGANDLPPVRYQARHEELIDALWLFVTEKHDDLDGNPERIALYCLTDYILNADRFPAMKRNPAETKWQRWWLLLHANVRKVRQLNAAVDDYRRHGGARMLPQARADLLSHYPEWVGLALANGRTRLYRGYIRKFQVADVVGDDEDDDEADDDE